MNLIGANCVGWVATVIRVGGDASAPINLRVKIIVGGQLVQLPRQLLFPDSIAIATVCI